MICSGHMNLYNIFESLIYHFVIVSIIYSLLLLDYYQGFDQISFVIYATAYVSVFLSLANYLFCVLSSLPYSLFHTRAFPRCASLMKVQVMVFRGYLLANSELSFVYSLCFDFDSILFEKPSTLVLRLACMQRSSFLCYFYLILFYFIC